MHACFNGSRLCLTEKEFSPPLLYPLRCKQRESPSFTIIETQCSQSFSPEQRNFHELTAMETDRRMNVNKKI